MSKINISPRLVAYIKSSANASPLYDGLPTQENLIIIQACTHLDHPTGTRIIFTRDGGFHSGGWIKNPDFEQCYHLSLSFVDRVTLEDTPHNHKLAKLWCKLIYGRDNLSRLLIESPKSPEGRIKDVWHYRLFCDAAWAPIIPRGEPYSILRTETGWRTWSEVNQTERELVILPADIR